VGTPSEVVEFPATLLLLLLFLLLLVLRLFHVVHVAFLCRRLLFLGLSSGPLCVNGVLDVDSCGAEDEATPDEYRETLAEADGGHAQDNVEDGFLPGRPLPAESCALLDGAGEVAALEEERHALHQDHQHAASELNGAGGDAEGAERDHTPDPQHDGGSAGGVGDDLLPEGLGLPERPRHHPHQVLHDDDDEADEGIEEVTLST